MSTGNVTAASGASSSVGMNSSSSTVGRCAAGGAAAPSACCPAAGGGVAAGGGRAAGAGAGGALSWPSDAAVHSTAANSAIRVTDRFMKVSLQIACDAEANVVAPIDSRAASCDAQVRHGRTAPARPADDMHGPARRAERVVDALGAFDHVGDVEILHPFGDVAAQIENPEGIRRVATHRRGHGLA